MESGLTVWQPTHWNRLINDIIGLHGLCLVEHGLRSPFGRSDNENNRNLCSQTGNTESAEIIRRDAILIGIDSGLSADEALPVLLDATEDPQYA